MFACRKLPYFSIIEILVLLYFESVVIFIFYILILQFKLFCCVFLAFLVALVYIYIYIYSFCSF